MKIKKELKSATFEYDEETKSFTISGVDELYSTVELNKVYASDRGCNSIAVNIAESLILFSRDCFRPII